MMQFPATRAFTLIETLVAVSLIAVAIVAPMSLVSQSFSVANYSRDEITAYNLAQEGIEAVRAIRDSNILTNAFLASGGTSQDLLTGIPINTPFTIDARASSAAAAIATCTGTCAPLQTDGILYGYGFCAGSTCNTDFTRTMRALYVGPATINGGKDIIRVISTVTWHTPNGQARTFTIYENMYRWINDSAAH